MISSDAFDYINVLNKAADASWLRQECISNNIANDDTPEYKRQDVDFEGVLSRELRHIQYDSLDKKVSNLKLSRLDVGTYIDSANYSYRIDKNNVDIDTENVELASNTIRYQGLTDSITQEFSRLKSVMK
ncbi:flagellar basal-body rod protein FlgB [Acetitomaculum ruminis DSM 5522]|uniref:Flagellar basal body rod protein FlgB n=1 Tax=Acetitomaculum ruminis DSM 5522 TaxID=1120918 RepID=A0A1I0ZHD8_9FIRM|nr:flagellar basal body rod protein FlgB [Acetitomaculum ruminis]SFB24941.1 flagellar basal-body rod protein FlgB [Acetitomaculum ruminis DSM 5522]